MFPDRQTCGKLQSIPVRQLTTGASDTPSVYIETTIPSYLTAWRSSDLVMAAKQQTTRRWWDEQRKHFDLFISDAVLLEAAAGDSEASQRRMDVLDGIPVLNPLPQADEIVAALIDRLALPNRALADAVYIAICVVHGLDYLLTWNCTHILPMPFSSLLFPMCATVLVLECP